MSTSDTPALLAVSRLPRTGRLAAVGGGAELVMIPAELAASTWSRTATVLGGAPGSRCRRR